MGSVGHGGRDFAQLDHLAAELNVRLDIGVLELALRSSQLSLSSAAAKGSEILRAAVSQQCRSERQ